MGGAPLRLTSRRDLAVAALAGGIITWMLVATVRLIRGHDPLLPWAGPLVLWFVALVVLVTAVIARRRFARERADIDPQQAVTFLVIGKTAALAGAMIGAGYAVFALLSVPAIDAPGPRDRVIRGGVAAVAGLVTMLAGHWLERQCRVPDPPGDGTWEEPADSDGLSAD